MPSDKTETTGKTSFESVTTSNTSPSIRDLAMRGTFWTFAGYFANMAVRLGSTLFMTRLLFPQAFGVMTIVNVYLQGVQMFSDFGIYQSIIQHQRGDERSFLDTAWTVSVIRGVGVWLVTCLLAWPVAATYDEPTLMWLLPLSGTTAIIGGFNSTALITLNRHIVLGRLVVLDFFTQLLASTTMVGLAFFWHEVWVLAAGSIISTLFKAVLSHLIVQVPFNRFCWDVTAIKEISQLGKYILFTTILAFFTLQGDRLVLGKYLSKEMLGIYSLAYTLTDTAALFVSSLSNRVLFPAFSRIVRENPSGLYSALHRARKHMDLSILPCIGIGFVLGGPLIKLIYDNRYADAAWIAQILSLRVAANSIIPAYIACLLALGKPQYNAIAQVFKICFLFAGIPYAWHLGGTQGAVWAVVIAEMGMLPAFWFGLIRNRLFSLQTELLAVVYFLAGMGFAYGVVRLILGS